MVKTEIKIYYVLFKTMCNALHWDVQTGEWIVIVICSRQSLHTPTQAGAGSWSPPQVHISPDPIPDPQLLPSHSHHPPRSTSAPLFLCVEWEPSVVERFYCNNKSSVDDLHRKVLEEKWLAEFYVWRYDPSRVTRPIHLEYLCSFRNDALKFTQ